jgi:hypothetical protein
VRRRHRRPVTRPRFDRSQRLGFVIAVALAATVAVVSIIVLVEHRTTHTIIVFNSASPGALDAVRQELDFDASVHADDLSYTSIDGTKVQTRDFLNEAGEMGVPVFMSLADLIGPTDLDRVNVGYHKQYGRNTTAQVHNIVSTYCSNKNVAGFYASDEIPGDPTGQYGLNTLAAGLTWLEWLRVRIHEIQSECSKPVIVSQYWGYRRSSYLRQVMTAGSMQLMMDYYPLPPDPAKYGTIAQIKGMAAVVNSVDPGKSWFSIQTSPNHGASNFPASAKAPTVREMVQMATLAVAGGVHNLAFFSYPLAAQVNGQRARVRAAIQQIETLPGW